MLDSAIIDNSRSRSSPRQQGSLRSLKKAHQVAHKYTELTKLGGCRSRESPRLPNRPLVKRSPTMCRSRQEQDSSRLVQDLAVSLTLSEMDDCLSPCVLSTGTAPYRIIAVNEAWSNLCGYTAEEAKGRTFKELLHGPATDLNKAHAFVDSLTNTVRSHDLESNPCLSCLATSNTA